jgi:MFS family permease
MTGRVQWRSLGAVLASTGGLGLAYGIGNTVTSVRFESWGLPGWVVGLAGAMPALAVIVLIPAGPAVAARLGAVRAMLAGGAVLTASFVLMPVLDAWGWWLLLRFVAGAGLALPWLVGETWINTVAPERWRGRVLAAYTVMIFGGWALGAQVVRIVGAEGWTVHAAGAAAMLLCAMPLVLGRRLAPSLHPTGRFDLRSAVALAPLAMLASLIGGIAEFGYISLIPSYAIEAGLPTADALQLLTALVVGGVVLQAAVGWLADRIDRARLLAGLGAALAVGAVGLAMSLSSAPSSPLPALVATVLLGGVVTGFYAVGLAVMGQRVPVERLAMANAAFLVSYETGAVIGPITGGAAMDVSSPHGLAVLMAMVGVAFAVLVGRWRTTDQVVGSTMEPAVEPISLPSQGRGPSSLHPAARTADEQVAGR